jgi:hypothetical protein
MRPWMMVSLRVTSPKKVSRYITGVMSQGFADKEIQDSAIHWKITCSVFQEIGSYILVDILEQNNSVHYVETMKKLKTWTAEMGH